MSQLKYKNIIDLLMMTNKACLKSNINSLLLEIWNDSPVLFLKLICIIRDPRNGLGKREFSYFMLQFLKDNFPKTYYKNIVNISKNYGYIKDLLIMSKYKSDKELEYFADILKTDLTQENISLAVKWAPREKGQYSDLALKLSKILYPDNKKSLELYRKNILKPLSNKILVVERLLSNNEWNINYNKITKGSIKKYGKNEILNNGIVNKGAFLRHDKDNFQLYNEKINKISKKNNIEFLLIEIEIFDVDENIENKIITLLNKYDVSVDNDDLQSKLNNNLINDENDNNDENILDFINVDNELDNDEWEIL